MNAVVGVVGVVATFVGLVVNGIWVIGHGVRLTRRAYRRLRQPAVDEAE
jgi:hypothetical protein